MRHVAAALAASRAVAPYEETMSRDAKDADEKAPVAQVAKSRLPWRRLRASDSWKPTHARP